MDKKKVIFPLAIFCGSMAAMPLFTGCSAIDNIRNGINDWIDGIVSPSQSKKTVTLAAGEVMNFDTKTGKVEILASGSNSVKVTTDKDSGTATIVLKSGEVVTIAEKEFTNDRMSDMEIIIDDFGTITVLPDTNPDTETDEGGDDGGEEKPPVSESKITNLANGKTISTGTTDYSVTLYTYQAVEGYSVRSLTLDKSEMSGDGIVIAAITANGSSVVLNIPDTDIHDFEGKLKVTVTLSDGSTEEDEINLSIHVSCLTGDMLITMSDGTQKRIDSLSVGEKVLSFNPVSMKLEADEITYSDSDENKSHTEYDIWTFSDGTIVKTVHRHRLYNIDRQTMVNMDEWKIGERAYNANGVAVSLVKHENVKETVNHYTIFTKNQNYFVNGLLSGNKYTAAMVLKCSE
jgi:lipoprotein